MDKTLTRFKLQQLAELYVVKKEQMLFPFFDQDFTDSFCETFGLFKLPIHKAAAWNRPQMETRHYLYAASKTLEQCQTLTEDHTLTSHKVYEGLLKLYNKRLPWWKRWLGGAL